MGKIVQAPPQEQLLLDLQPSRESAKSLDAYFEIQSEVRQAVVREWNRVVKAGNSPRPSSAIAWIWEIRRGITSLAPKLRSLQSTAVQGMAKALGHELRILQKQLGGNRVALPVPVLSKEGDYLEVPSGVTLQRAKRTIHIPVPCSNIRVSFCPPIGVPVTLSSNPASARIMRYEDDGNTHYQVLLNLEDEPIHLGPAEGVKALDWGASQWLFWNQGNPIYYPSRIRSLYRELIALSKVQTLGLPISQEGYEQRRLRNEVREELDRLHRTFYRVAARDAFQDSHTIVIEDFRRVLKRESSPKFVPSIIEKSVLRALNRCQWNLMLRIFQWVAAVNHRKLILLNPANSTRSCSKCGIVNERFLPLRVREWVCPNCGSQNQRDGNSEDNLLNEYYSIQPYLK